MRRELLKVMDVVGYEAEAPYAWMVFDVERQRCEWFKDERAAREWLRDADNFIGVVNDRVPA